MERVAVFLAALAPALAFLGYAGIKAKVDWRSEALWNAFLMGAVAGVGIWGGAALIQTLLGEVIDKVASVCGRGLLLASVKAFGAAAVPEETAKFVVLLWIAEAHVDVRRKQDILPLAAAVSLGFAAFENLIYVSQGENWQGIASFRSLTAVPGHGVDGLIMGALVTFARLTPEHRRPYLLAALTAAITCHTAYDFPLMAKDAPGTGAWLFVVWVAVLVITGMSAAIFSNKALSKASVADLTVSGPHPIAGGSGVVAAGILIMVSGGPIAAYFVYVTHLPWPAIWAVLLSSAIPVILGGDLLRWRRCEARQADLP